VDGPCAPGRRRNLPCGGSELVGDTPTLIERHFETIPSPRTLLMGFDFPIGLPIAYARLAGISDFLSALPDLGRGKWARFFDVAEKADEISLNRPFYPMRPGGTRQQHLVGALTVGHIDELRRSCEMPRPGRRAACPLFWTLGGQQVGKGAISGWQEVLIPALLAKKTRATLWPFSGPLEDLLAREGVVLAETYPAEFYDHLGVAFSNARRGERAGKRVQRDRAANATSLLGWAATTGVEVNTALRSEIEDGFGKRANGEDRFDAVVGLFGMLNIILGHRHPGYPTDEYIRRIEGWILGQDAGNGVSGETGAIQVCWLS
jgi:hypothetical protein